MNLFHTLIFSSFKIRLMPFLLSIVCQFLLLLHILLKTLKMFVPPDRSLSYWVPGLFFLPQWFSEFLVHNHHNWLVTNEIQHKIQTFVNRCLRYILRIRWPNIISNKDLWKATGQEDINLEIRKGKFRWIGHTLRKEDGEIPKAALHWNPQGNRKGGRPKNSWRRSVSRKRVEAGMN